MDSDQIASTVDLQCFKERINPGTAGGGYIQEKFGLIEMIRLVIT